MRAINKKSKKAANNLSKIVKMPVRPRSSADLTPFLSKNVAAVEEEIEGSSMASSIPYKLPAYQKKRKSSNESGNSADDFKTMIDTVIEENQLDKISNV
jgi:hypothetical protein